jgi:hypothetical protein
MLLLPGLSAALLGQGGRLPHGWIAAGGFLPGFLAQSESLGAGPLMILSEDKSPE